MQLQFILNPTSGNARRALPVVRAFAARHDARLTLTERCGHGREIAAAAAAEGVEVVVAVGGDGTMNEVASALIGTSSTLGLIPCGSGDGLGRHLGIHGPLDRALALLEHGRARMIDTATADGHPFFTAAGLGFEAILAARFNAVTRRGFSRYLLESALAWRRHAPASYLIQGPASSVRVSAFTLAVANCAQYGNNARIAPHAQVDDGLLDLCAIPAVTWLNSLPLVTRLFHGDISTMRGVTSLQASRFVVEREEPGPLHTDGEVHAAGRRVEFVVRPASLRIIGPADRGENAAVRRGQAAVA